MKRYRSDRGASLVELAVSLPVLLAILIGAADFGRVFYHSQQLIAAARAGAQFAAVSVTNSTDNTNIRNTVIAAAPNLRPILSTGDITLGDSAVTGNATAQIPMCVSTDGSSWVYPTSAQPWTCSTSTCPGSEPNLACYVKVTVTKPFTIISAYIPVPTPLSTSRTAWQRVQ